MQEFSRSPGLLNEDQLVLGASAGDKEAYGRLVEMHQSSLRSFLRSLSHNDPDLADDLAQDTFIIAYQQFRAFRGEGSFLSWLMGIGYRRFLQHARKQKRRRELLEGKKDIPAFTPALDRNMAMDLEKALTCLSLKEKTVIILNSREGFTHEEIAETTGMPLGTVKSHISRGRDKLKEILGGKKNHNE